MAASRNDTAEINANKDRAVVAQVETATVLAMQPPVHINHLFNNNNNDDDDDSKAGQVVIGLTNPNETLLKTI